MTLNVEIDLPIEVNGVAAQTALLDADQEDVPSFITFNDIRMVVVRRSKGVGIRLWDNTRQERRTFPNREWYPVKEELRVPATFIRYDVPKIVKMPDILGAILDERMEGYVTFELNGRQYELIVSELPDRRLFIQFMDETNGHPTYPSGRYHYTDAHEDGKVFIDFNKAYSPPCAFTDYATCTFPPQENHLTFNRSGRDLPKSPVNFMIERMILKATLNGVVFINHLPNGSMLLAPRIFHIPYSPV